MNYELGQTAALEKLGLHKEAARLRGVHGSSGAWDELKNVGGTVLKNDPNPKGLYASGNTPGNRKAIEAFAQDAVESRGGTPTGLETTIDTSTGWEPRTLNSWARKNDVTLEDVEDAVYDLDNMSRGPEARGQRGEVYELLNRAVGAWKNTVPGATAPVTKNWPVPPKT